MRPTKNAPRRPAARTGPHRPVRLGWLTAALCLALASAPEIAHAQDRPASEKAPGKTQEKAPENIQQIRRFEDWELRCEQKDEWEEKTCYIVQSLKADETGRRVLQILVARFGAEQALGALISVPIGIRLPPGIVLQIDKKPARRFPLERCTPQTCQAQVRLADKLLASFKAGASGRVTFHDASGQTVNVSFSLKGFTAAFKELP